MRTVLELPASPEKKGCTGGTPAFVGTGTGIGRKKYTLLKGRHNGLCWGRSGRITDLNFLFFPTFWERGNGEELDMGKF